MPSQPRWDLAVTHRGDDLTEFVEDYFGRPDRRVLLIAGAGFDPRSTLVCDLLASVAPTSLRGVFVREERPAPDVKLVEMADTNASAMTRSIPNHEVVRIPVFDASGTLIGGRRISSYLAKLSLDGFTDVVVDLSALSVGISFPIVKFLFAQCCAEGPGFNLHVFVAHHPGVDRGIVSVPSEIVTPVHGFAGELTLTANKEHAARLWLPQLAPGRGTTLGKIHQKVEPDEVCPILPFPASDPRRGDSLLEELLEAGDIPWATDARSIVYADEGDPLDLYRTILRLHALRKPVFEELGGSKLILSPVGSKVMALGALLAALEEDLPVMYLETFSYEVEGLVMSRSEPELLHVWLVGALPTDTNPVDGD